MVVLLLGLVLTFVAVHQTQKNAKDIANQDFKSNGNDIKLKLDARLKAHALLLRSGAAFFAASDTVTQEEWRKFIESEKINRNLPGIQGVGYSLIIPKNQLKQHIQSFIKNGFPDYNVIPVGNREIYDNDNISDEELLYDSQSKNKVTNKDKPNLYLKLPMYLMAKNGHYNLRETMKIYLFFMVKHLLY